MDRVNQTHDDGCFIACVAIILGKTYQQAYKLVHPEGLNEFDWCVGMTPEESLKRLSNWVDLKPSKVRRIRDLRRDALLLIRWNYPPYTLMHAVVYDAKKRKLLDPGGLTISHGRYESQLDSVMYIKVKDEKKAKANRGRNHRTAA